jgi:hypothetical protein
MNRGRMALVLVPVPDGGSLPGEIEVGGARGLEAILSLSQVPMVQTVRSPAPHLPPTPSVPNEGEDESERTGRIADLKRLKRAVERLPKNHPLRLSLHGEPDEMPRAELVQKLREWAKCFAWEER